ncbi:MAG: efflux RND transporter periplasmic adaptor subunit [Xanthomonadales bacterium]|nr:efflux RND transporter periplasmic adaptor subunit [Gammaproteobacteria bacterium]MBT8055105.1 efflux RND transporter periplasmic adaptor subunit [Gammaproteobacteria bacterium]NND58406.1 efflux RND transporter periplasmic adaptor subunit [Xanthomonadales bacterium]NNK51699.1 efflux RND transporter periplasmic adaptor subunit [Xanthomonadales bacterium]
MKIHRHIAAGLATTFLFIPGLCWPQMGGPALVRVAEASLQDIAPVTMVPGTVVSRNDARLSAEVPGRLISVADVGTEVVVGNPVAEIEDTMLRLQYVELQAQVSRAEARLRFLESEEKRFSRLAESNLAAATQLEQTRSDRDVARGDLGIANSQLEQIADQLQRTRIRAPFDGVVVERLMTPGERVIEGSNVVRLVDQASLEIIARAPLDYFPFVKKGQALDVSSRTLTATVRVRTVVAVGDYNTHQFELRLDLEPGLLPVGQTVRVSIPTAVTRKVLAVPRDALVLRPEGESVFVVDSENQAQQIRVRVGAGRGDYVEILGDVAPGDMVVIRGNERLQPGQSVSILDG